ncbi:tetratricopeptide repeat protein [Sphingomonas quercus]|uniref:Tetratricopeptide repeat protein n=1 Tax=Sphingomonas quercus TaxID=2842451 RepID=A0ABS6BGA7_9SPHN|nr:tetratricopeptide repeat protein [Sphingomonas quercus]MBU3077327.1 tetratricopeptide repeat protein [Sphingomonas quercus]
MIEQAIAANPMVPSFHNNLGNALRAQGALEPAARAFEQALRLNPNHGDAHHGLGTVRIAQGELEKAAMAFRRALALQPNHPDALAGLGTVLVRQGRNDEAVAALRAAVAARPHDPAILNNLGNALRATRNPRGAEEAYRRALQASPQAADSAYNLALLLFERDAAEEAASLCRRAIQSKPGSADPYVLLAAILRDQGQATEAQAVCDQALHLFPDSAGARLGIAIGSVPLFVRTAQESAAAPQAFARATDELASWALPDTARLGPAVGSAQPFYLAYRPFDVTEPLARYGDLMSKAAHEYFRPGSDLGKRPEGRDRLRLVVVSAQVREHPVWEMILRGIVAELDPAVFELMIFHTGAQIDGETDWARSRADRFLQGPMPLAAWIDAVTEARPDILFFPEIGMDAATTALAALRLAPLQVAAWGHPITSGLPTIDLYMSGDLIEPADGDRHYREQLVRLPGTGVCTQPPSKAVEAWGDPGRQPGTVRFALCHQSTKFDPGDDALIVEIARRVGRCEMWLVASRKHRWASEAVSDRLARALRAGGIDPSQVLRQVPWLAPDAFAGFLEAMDVYLDCPSFSGYTTAHGALARGLPLITLEGQFMRQRLAAGLLRQIGITDTIASSRADYVDKAVAAAESCRAGEGAAGWRSRIRAAALLADGNREAVRAFAAALIEAFGNRP